MEAVAVIGAVGLTMIAVSFAAAMLGLHSRFAGPVLTLGVLIWVASCVMAVIQFWWRHMP
jgi:hypothetical protein